MYRASKKLVNAFGLIAVLGVGGISHKGYDYVTGLNDVTSTETRTGTFDGSRDGKLYITFPGDSKECFRSLADYDAKVMTVGEDITVELGETRTGKSPAVTKILTYEVDRTYNNGNSILLF
jgi:hypothetical protein